MTLLDKKITAANSKAVKTGGSNSQQSGKLNKDLKIGTSNVLSLQTQST
jgi:hypothetical protein